MRLSMHLPKLGTALAAALLCAMAGCGDDTWDDTNETTDLHDHGDEAYDFETIEQALSADALSQQLLGAVHRVSWGYQPNRVHAGIDFGGVTNNTTRVKSPIAGEIIANTSACGKVAIFDGTNTHIFAHMSNRTALTVGSRVSVNTYLGTTSNVVGGGCSASGAHLHYEIRTGRNATMAAPSSDNRASTRDPLTYPYTWASTRPTVRITAPAVGASLRQGAQTTVSWSASHPTSALSNVAVDVVSGSATSCIGTTALRTLYTSTSYRSSASVTLPSLSPGTYNLKVAVRAGDGQWGCDMRRITLTSPSTTSPSTSPPPLNVNTTYSGTIARGQELRYTFQRRSGRAYTVTLQPSSGDPDLYTSSLSSLSRTSYQCRSNRSAGSADVCTFTATTTGTNHVLIHGFSAATFTLRISER